MKEANDILKEDLQTFSLPSGMVEQLRGNTIIVTGATGLIGSAIVRCLHALEVGVRFVLPVRNPGKARDMLRAEMDSAAIEPLDVGLTEWFDSYAGHADYIIHCASTTDGSYMCEHPAETFMMTIDSTRAMLDYARRESGAGHTVRGIVYISSLEYYGQITDDEPVAEERQGYVERQSPRSSYALGKQAAEYLCYCYACEYGIPAKSARLTQTFGAGIPKTDNRVFAQFARSVIEGRDIVLHTEGRSAKPYCYTTDCVSAIFHILLKGEAGETYNVATPGTYITIRDLAELFRTLFAPGIRVLTEIRPGSTYAPETRINLDPSRLLALGWSPRHNLPEMLTRLVSSLRSDHKPVRGYRRDCDPSEARISGSCRHLSRKS